MNEKKEYTPKEVAEALLKRAKDIVSGSDLAKSDPRNKTESQMGEFNIPHQVSDHRDQAPEKVIAKQPLQLKKFMEKCAMKKAQMTVKEAVEEIKGDKKVNEVLPEVHSEKRDDVLRELREDKEEKKG